MITTKDHFLFHKYDPNLGWVLQEDSKGILAKHGEFAVELNHNSHGMRNDQINLTKTKPRIAVLGDSFAYGFGVEEKDIFSSKIDYKNYEVLNFGVSAYGSDQLLLQLINKVSKFQPDVILYLHTIGTEIRNCRYFHKMYPKPIFLVDPESGRAKVYTKHLKKNSFSLKNDKKSRILKKWYTSKKLYAQLIDEMYKYHTSQGHVLEDYGDFLSLNEVSRYDENSYYKTFLVYSVTEYIFSQITRFCNANDIKLIFLIGTAQRQFVDFFDDAETGDSVKLNKKLPNIKIATILEKLEVDCVDLFDPLLQYENINSHNHFKIDGHWNSFGHNNVSEITNDYLRANL